MDMYSAMELVPELGFSMDADQIIPAGSDFAYKYVENIYHQCTRKGRGAAIGSGNSIPEYVSDERYLKAIETVRRLRGD